MRSVRLDVRSVGSSLAQTYDKLLEITGPHIFKKAVYKDFSLLFFSAFCLKYKGASVRLSVGLTQFYKHVKTSVLKWKSILLRCNFSETRLYIDLILILLYTLLLEFPVTSSFKVEA